MSTTNPSFTVRTAHLLLALSLALPGLPARAAETDVATNAIGSLNGALSGVNGFFSAFGSSNLQLQALASQLGQAQQQAGGMQQSQSQFDQVQQQLSTAMLEAQNCVQKATRTYDKFYEKRSAQQKEVVKSLTTDQITGIEPRCSTYGVILDAIALNKARMEDSNKKMSCIMNLQNTVNQIVEKAKAPFQQLNGAATEVYKTHSQIIDSHKKIAEQMSLQLNGKEGKGGYREQLGKLKQMSLDLNNVLNGKGGEKDGLKFGLVKQVENLRQLRVNAANSWYFNLMSDVEYCYRSEPVACFDNDVLMPPAQCIGAMIQNEAEGKRNAGARARGKTDREGLQRIGLRNYMNAQKINIPANIDVGRPDEFLSFTRTRFEETLQGMLGAYRGHQFATSIDKSKLNAFVGKTYRDCYDKTVKNFQSDMISKGGKYYGAITQMKDSERETSNDLKNWIDRVEGQVSEFRTSFFKVYNSELAQFKTDCTAEEDPYKSLDCLRVLNAQLESGIRGTRRATRLSNGSNYVVNAGEINLPMQRLVIDSAGKPKVESQPAACSGFDDCLNLMDREIQGHSSAQQKGEEERSKFVQQHNSAMRASFDLLSGQFAQMSQVITAGVNAVNKDLAEIGIKASIKTKAVEGEELKENKDTGMIDMPKSFKAAMAGRNAYTEIEDTKDVTSAYNSLIGELTKKGADALKMKRRCQIDESDYKRLLGFVRNCEDTDAICRTDLAKQSSGAIGTILDHSRDNLDENNSRRRSSASEYSSCESAVKAENSVDSSDDTKIQAWIDENKPELGSIFTGANNADVDRRKKADAIKLMRAGAGKNLQNAIRARCSEIFLNGFEADVGESRSSVKQQNSNIVSGLRQLVAACSSADMEGEKYKDTNGSVKDACEEYKKFINAAKPPKDEAETPTQGVGRATEPSVNPLGSPGATPAK